MNQKINKLINMATSSFFETLESRKEKTWGGRRTGRVRRAAMACTARRQPRILVGNKKASPQAVCGKAQC